MFVQGGASGKYRATRQDEATALKSLSRANDILQQGKVAARCLLGGTGILRLNATVPGHAMLQHALETVKSN